MPKDELEKLILDFVRSSITPLLEDVIARKIYLGVKYAMEQLKEEK